MINVIPNAKAHIQQQALTCDIEDLENRFDNLQNTKASLKNTSKTKTKTKKMRT